MTCWLLRSRPAVTAAIRVASALACASLALAQERPAPPPSLSGTWTLDRYLSDHPEQIVAALRIDMAAPDREIRAEGLEGQAGGDARRRGPGRGRVDGDGRSSPQPAGAADQLIPADRKRVDELVAAVQFAPTSLTITQTDTAVTIAAGSDDGTETLATNGRSEKYPLRSGTVNRIASWQGSQLLVKYEIGSAGSLTHTYSIVPTTQQLLVRVNGERVSGEPGPFDIKLVYDRVDRPDSPEH